MLDLERGPSGASQVAAHDAPIKAVRWVDAYGGLLVTGSWDKTVKVSRLCQTYRCTTHESASTGTCARPRRSRACSCRNDVIAWTSGSPSWSSAARSGTSWSSTLPNLRLCTRYAARPRGVPFGLMLCADDRIATEVADTHRRVLHDRGRLRARQRGGPRRDALRRG
jgi:hypothetical protein